MDTPQTQCPSPSQATQPTLWLQDELTRLAPALDGFPVDALLDVYVTAGQQGRDHAYRLVDSCLENWIASLEGSLSSYPHAPDDALARVQARQRGARDALTTLKSALARVDGVVSLATVGNSVDNPWGPRLSPCRG